MFPSHCTDVRTNPLLSTDPLRRALLLCALVATNLGAGARVMAAEATWAYLASGNGSHQDIAQPLLARPDAAFITGGLYREGTSAGAGSSFDLMALRYGPNDAIYASGFHAGP